MFEEPTKLELARPPAIALTRVDCLGCESEEDSPFPLAKSKISLTSTVDSPLLSGRKGTLDDDTTEED